jgi:hypothetical protein
MKAGGFSKSDDSFLCPVSGLYVSCISNKAIQELLLDRNKL